MTHVNNTPEFHSARSVPAMGASIEGFRKDQSHYLDLYQRRIYEHRIVSRRTTSGLIPNGDRVLMRLKEEIARIDRTLEVLNAHIAKIDGGVQ